MTRAIQAARILLGLIFVVFGLNGFFMFIPVRPTHPLILLLISSGYIYFVKVVEILAGALLLANRAVVLALVLLGADIANIAMYHILLDHNDWFIVPVVLALYTVLLYGYRPRMKFIFRWKETSGSAADAPPASHR